MAGQTLNYINFEQAQQAPGLRMIVVQGIPSPWGEAAKGIFHIKQLTYSACYHDPASREMSAWSGSRSAPVAIYNNETPASGWLDILKLAERLQPSPRLIPQDSAQAKKMLDLCENLAGEMGLGWCRRLDSIHKGNYPQPIANYLAKKYGYRESQGPQYAEKTIALLKQLSNQLKQQQAAGQPYYVGDNITAADIFSATFIACFAPLPQNVCPMNPIIREVFETLDTATAAALDPILLAHRDFIYQKHLALPLSL
jgi:glutathione S-transferase